MFSRIVAASELILAAGLWGFGFIASRWAMEELSPFALTFARFALVLVGFAPFVLKRSLREFVLIHLRRAFWPGVLLAGTLILQTWGLNHTTATKAGFITTLYVVFMPFLESWVEGKSLPRALWVCVGVSVLGMALIVNLDVDSLNKGDLLTLACALLATFQIYVVGQVSPGVSRPFLFTVAQSIWAALVCLPFALDAASWEAFARFPSWTMTAQCGLLSLTLGSTVVGFTLQMRAQARLSPTVSSLIFLLESPFAMIFAVIFLAESLGAIESAGAILIFLSAIGACLVESRQKNLISPEQSPTVVE